MIYREEMCMYKNENQKYILHIVKEDKFCDGYISFMKNYMQDYEHRFIIIKGNGLFSNGYRDVKIVRIKELCKRDNLDSLFKAYKIIVSGIFGVEIVLAFFPKSILKKVYLQFWGGDFYSLRERLQKHSFVQQFKIWCKLKLIQRCQAVILLIDTEYQVFTELIGFPKKYFVAPMPADPNQHIDFVALRKSAEKENPVSLYILVGNSATPENQHIECFKMLKKFLEYNIQVICPLSYGDEEYKKQVIKNGNLILGDSFVPITQYMEYYEYCKVLAKCDIGIFNVNRQQALGNIILMLQLRKKVFIRQDTSMWQKYKKDGIILYRAEQISNLSFEEFIGQTEEEKIENEKRINQETGVESSQKMWDSVFIDEDENGK